MQNPITQALSAITLGAPVVFRSNPEPRTGTRTGNREPGTGNPEPAEVAMFPLLGPQTADREPFYLTLDDAIGQAWTEVTEISEQGSVPELRVINKGAKPVFILDGEELVGAKQNRVVNLSILVPAASTVVIPVSCVEAGRWRSRSRAFSSSPRAQYSAGRARRMAQVTSSMQLHKAYRSDQADVWADIAAKSARLRAPSATSAMEEIFTVHAKFTERCVEELRPVERQCGALFMIDGAVVGFDLFDSAVTLRRLLPKLVRSVAVDALDRAAESEREMKPELIRQVAEHFLELAGVAPVHAAPAIGEGEDVRIVHPKLSGGALVTSGGALHVSAFAIK